MFRVTTLRVLALLVVAAGAYLWPSLTWMREVDECTGSGGVMHYDLRACSMSDSVSTGTRVWYAPPSKVEYLAGALVMLMLIGVFAVRDRVDGPAEK